MALQFLPILLLGLHTGRGGRPAAEAAHPADHADAERRRHRRRWPRSRSPARYAPADVYAFALLSGLIFAFDAPARQAFVAEVVPPRPAPGRDRAERRGVPGDPADRAGPREPAHRERGHRWVFAVNAACYLGPTIGLLRLRPSDLTPAPGRPPGSPARCGRPRGTCAGARTSLLDDLPGRDGRHVRPQLPDRADRDGEVGVRRQRQHVRPVQHRPRDRVGGRRAAGRGRRPPAAARPSCSRRPRSGCSRRPRRSRRTWRPSSSLLARHGLRQPGVPGHGQRVGPARRRPRAARPGDGPVHAGLHRRHAHRRARSSGRSRATSAPGRA